jgi:hypothetical protein
MRIIFYSLFLFVSACSVQTSGHNNLFEKLPPRKKGPITIHYATGKTAVYFAFKYSSEPESLLKPISTTTIRMKTVNIDSEEYVVVKTLHNDLFKAINLIHSDYDVILNYLPHQSGVADRLKSSLKLSEIVPVKDPTFIQKIPRQFLVSKRKLENATLFEEHEIHRRD